MSIEVVQRNHSEYGLILPYLEAQEGQVLMFNGEAWVPSDIELAIPGEGTEGPEGPVGPQGPQGPKGDKGERGLSEIAYLRDEKPSGTMGGSCNANGWQQRELNVLGGDTDFITLSNSRFTLKPGKYFIEIQAPAYMVGYHQAKLVVTNTGADALIGTSNVAHPSYGVTNYSTIMGELIVNFKRQKLF